MSSNAAKREAFVSAATKYSESVVAIDLDSVSKIDLQNIADSAGLKFPHWITRVSDYKVGRGLWKIPLTNGVAKATPSPKKKAKKVAEPVASEPITITDKPTAPTSVVEMTKGTTSTVSNIPAKDPLFVPIGNFSDVNSIFKSNMFYPI